jgi:hypothetical protein
MFYLRMLSITRPIRCRIMDLRGAVQNSASIFSSDTTITVTVTFTCIEGTSFTKVRLFFQMRETLYDGCVKSLLRHRKLFTHAAFQLVVFSRNGVLEVYLSGDQADGTREGTKLDCAEDEVLIHTPVWPNASNSLF